MKKSVSFEYDRQNVGPITFQDFFFFKEASLFLTFSMGCFPDGHVKYISHDYLKHSIWSVRLPAGKAGLPCITALVVQHILHSTSSFT